MAETNEKEKIKEISRNSSIRRSKRNSRASSRASRASMPMDLGSSAAVAKDAFSEVDEFDEDNLPPTDSMRILKLSARDWPILLTGSIAATINGAVLPICALVISYILGFLGEPDVDTKTKGITDACFFFLGLAGVNLVSQFLQGWVLKRLA